MYKIYHDLLKIGIYRSLGGAILKGEKMQQYKELLQKIVNYGMTRPTGTQGVPNIVYPGCTMEFFLDDGFPLLTLRSLRGSWRAIVEELLWFLSGSRNVKDLHKKGVHLWDAWATPEITLKYGLPPGDVGPIYGFQWRSWPSRQGNSIDQISRLVDEIKSDPNSKRMMVTSWNPDDVGAGFIAPCHGIFKTVVAEGCISLVHFQRSADVPIGIPFNVASYALLLLMLAQVVNLKPWRLVHVFADAHVYQNQLQEVEVMLKREPRPLPFVRLNPAVKDLFSFKLEDFELVGYDPHPPMKITVSI